MTMCQLSNCPISQAKNSRANRLAHTCTASNAVRRKCWFTTALAGGARVGRLAHWSRDERGQDLVEWTVGLPVFLLLCAGIVFYAWVWWNQLAAAAAVHDGAYLAAIRGGDTGAGYARTQRMLRSAVGGSANSYSISISTDASRRSVAGTVRNSSLFSLPYLGAMPLNIQARSFQRLEQFYGGPPTGWW